MDTKTCSRCRKTLPLSEFHSDRSRPDGHLIYCKFCKRAYAAAHPYVGGKAPKSTYDTKVCSRCRKTVPARMFWGCRSSRDGLYAYCKPCGKAVYATYSQTEAGKAARRRFNVSEKRKLITRRYRSTAKWQQTQKAYNALERVKAAHREKVKRYLVSQKGRTARLAYERSDKFRQVQRRFRSSDAGKAVKARSHAKRRGAMKTDLPLTAQEWLTILVTHNYSCHWCGRSGIRLEQDHVVPLTKGGLHVRENVVPACRSCNAKKGNRDPSRVFDR